MTLNKYNEVMDKVVVTKDMHDRILQNINKELSGEKKVSRFAKIAEFKKYIPYAAAVLVLLAGASMFIRNNDSTSTGSLQQGLSHGNTGHVFSDEAAFEAVPEAAEEALAPRTIGKDFSFLSGLASKIEQNKYDNEIIETTYHIGGNEIKVWQMPESLGKTIPGKYSGLASYEDSGEVKVADLSIEIMGNDGKYTMARWNQDGIVYELLSSDAMTMEEMDELLREIIICD